MFRIVGPNTLAVLVPVIGLDASFAHLKPVAGGIAFVAESGADRKSTRLNSSH